MQHRLRMAGFSFFYRSMSQSRCPLQQHGATALHARQDTEATKETREKDHGGQMRVMG